MAKNGVMSLFHLGKETDYMYKTRNIELVVNDAILYVCRKAMVHLTNGVCTLHGEGRGNELCWTLRFADYREADKFYAMFVKSSVFLLRMYHMGTVITTMW